MMADRLIWERDGRDWPNRDSSIFVNAAGLRWHVQRMGSGPVVLMLHGTGSATHSWRTLAPLLAHRFTVVAPDLPGHGFTGMPQRRLLSLPGMAGGLAALLEVLGCRPDMAVGHSAGAAILLRMTLDGAIAPRVLVSFNGAFLPFVSGAGRFFSPLAKLLAANSLVPKLLSWSAGSRTSVQRLIRDTGSVIDAAGVDFYTRLLRHPEHIEGALRMMANWDLEPLQQDLRRLATPLLLVVGSKDRSISPDAAFHIRDIVPNATVEVMSGLGHLAHEEKPEWAAQIIENAAVSAGLLAGSAEHSSPEAQRG